ncbi:RdRP-domain-containing protein [Trichodelitschia bisporula]|uniref:RNA-dependent RNA polymerase n=1 Tax=Trichodelitschia bisporula TaxID=703511 RepID=A0A6G1HV56_9PEZI|nr:RdRP-domain-containing protein [Trichodelitschia bisporula]
MADFRTTSGELVTPKRVIRRLGDFASIRCPAKCAAQIGQAFTDTRSCVVEFEEMIRAKDVERDGRVFSDGCGTISPSLVKKTVAKYPHLKPGQVVIFQTRYKGAKGVVSLDPALEGDVLTIRDSMWKFESDATELEVCGMADKPLPLFLNQQTIKLLEDLGVPHPNFMEVQVEEISVLQKSVSSPVHAALFFEKEIGDQAGFSGLIRRLSGMGLDVSQDRFLGG